MSTVEVRGVSEREQQAVIDVITLASAPTRWRDGLIQMHRRIWR